MDHIPTPPRVVRKIRSTLRTFLRHEATSGLILMVAAALALIIANSSLAESYFHTLHLETGPVLARAIGPMTVHLWINDGLMAIFFLFVGLEIKRELVDGRLSSPERRRLPVVAAAAGMLVPALVFLAIAGGDARFRSGWAIPAATDIAFAIGVLALLGKRISPALKLFLMTVAIVDDCGAVAIIALAYSSGIDGIALAGAGGVVMILLALKQRRVMWIWPYLVGFVALWWLVLLSGVHATVAGVVTAMLVPVTKSPGMPDSVESPLHRLEHALSPWVAFGIVPLFAFANAGVSFAGITLATSLDPLVLGIAGGLFLGKQVGIMGGVALAEKLGFAKRPKGMRWIQLYGIALLAGIGFTMSLFIGGLAFPGDATLQDEVKIGVLAGSTLAAVAGYLVLRIAPAARKVRDA